jgi:hypothetical protein
MLSQPATKIFLKTSEPHASEWISKAIGEIEIERFRESRTLGKFPRNSENQSRDITREPLVMASEVAGLDPLHGYLKHGNLVLRMRFPYLELHANAEKYIERKVGDARLPEIRAEFERRVESRALPVSGASRERGEVHRAQGDCGSGRKTDRSDGECSRRAAARGRAGCSAEEAARPGQRAAALLRVKTTW